MLVCLFVSVIFQFVCFGGGDSFKKFNYLSICLIMGNNDIVQTFFFNSFFIARSQQQMEKQVFRIFLNFSRV